MIRTTILVGVLFACLTLPAIAQKDKPKKPEFTTPQEVFEAFDKASAKDDFKTMAELMAPQMQKEMASEFAVESMTQRARLKNAKDKEAKVAEILKPVFDTLNKYGLSEKATKDIKLDEREKAKKTVIALVKDPAGLLAELLAIFDKFNREPKKKEKETAKLEGLKIAGDKASGTIVLKKGDREEKQPVAFVKVDGSWRIIPPFERK